MLKLFQSLFERGAVTTGRYPEAIVEMAIERAIDGTDPLLRTLSGYKKALRPAVLKAIDHVVALIDSLPPTVEMSRRSYRAEVLLPAFFASADRIGEVLGRDQALAELVAGKLSRDAEPIYALLAARRFERRGLGMELQGEILRRDVAQTTVSFADHHLLDPSTSEEETRKQLRRRAFDHVLALALDRITSLRQTRASLQARHKLLQRKLAALEAGHWGFADARPGAVVDTAALEAELAEIDAQMHSLGTDARSLHSHLEVLVEVLGAAASQLCAEPITLIVDRMGVKRQRVEDNALELELHELHSARGRSLVALPVCIPHDELPKPRDFLAEAQRYLA
jgi:hypothetical protein